MPDGVGAVSHYDLVPKDGLERTIVRKLCGDIGSLREQLFAMRLGDADVCYNVTIAFTTFNSILLQRNQASAVHDPMTLMCAPLLGTHDGAALVELTGLLSLGTDFAGDSTGAKLVSATSRTLATVLTVMVELRGRLT